MDDSHAMESNFDEVLNEIVDVYDQGMTLKVRQREVLESVWEKEKDMIISLPTGYGKSVIFHLIGE